MMRGMRSAARYIWIIVFIAFVGGFLLLETSGLLGNNAITPSTKVATVNGRDIVYVTWVERLQNAIQEQQQQAGRPLTMDESRNLEDRILDEMILEILLDAEYKRRGITVTDDEIRRAAQEFPYPPLMQSADLQTDGKFDWDKYRRFLSSPGTRSSGTLQFLTEYYRSEIPRRKLFDQLVADVYVTDADLWERYQAVHDSVHVTYVALTAESHGDTIQVDVTDTEIRNHYNAHQDLYEQVGRAVVSYVHLPRVVSAADSAAIRDRITALRGEIVAGGDSVFMDLARIESDDQRTSQNGGDLPPGVSGQFYGPEFDAAAAALRPGEVSAPVLTPFGYHLIQLREKRQDTLYLRHLLLELRPADSAAVALDRRADSLASMAAGSAVASRFDEATAAVGLTPQQALVFEGQALMVGNNYIPSVAAWSFSGVLPGESSDLFDADDGFYMARLDSLVEGGVQPLDDVRETIRMTLARQKVLERLIPVAEKIASRAVETSLEAAATEFGATAQPTMVFTRTSFVPGMGRDNEAIGASFALAVGAISKPIQTEDAVFVIRADSRVIANRDTWAAQRDAQRTILLQSLQQERIQNYVRGLRDAAKVEDFRKEITRLGRETVLP